MLVHRILLASWLCCAGLANRGLADLVQVAASNGRAPTRAIEGTVLDYTGRVLKLQTAAGRQRVFPAGRIRAVQTDWNPEHQAGNQAWRQADWQAAVAHYRAANRAESRAWVRRQILSRLMRCHQAMGDLTAAGKLFLLIVSSDPETPAYQYLPLCWSAAAAADPKQAESWLAEVKVPAAMLLGASHLLATPARARALDALIGLRQRQARPQAKVSASAPISTFATVQIWRARALEATQDDVRRWTRQVETFPEPLRAGPYFVLGACCQRLRQPQQATLFYLRLPILYGDHIPLAARALLAAARLQQQKQDQTAAITLLKEVVSRYKGTIEYPIAQRLLQDWNK